MIAMIHPVYLVCGGMIALALLGMIASAWLTPWEPTDDTDARLADLAERVARLERAAQKADRR